MILDMAHKLENYVSQKGAQKYFEGNIDKVINDYIKISKESNINKTYLKVFKKWWSSTVAKIIRSQELFKSKGELIKFANYLGVKVNKKKLLQPKCKEKFSNSYFIPIEVHTLKICFYKKKSVKNMC